MPTEIVDQSAASITLLAGGPPAILPGEPESEYQAGLASVIKELQAKTQLQIYLAEKIFSCLWWIRRYERHKNQTIIHAMAKILSPASFSPELNEEQSILVELLEANEWSSAPLKGCFTKSGLTYQSLMQSALKNCYQHIASVDDQIALRVKTMKGFQTSYEALVNRKIYIERIRLQNDLMRRDLKAIDSMDTVES